MNLCAMRHSFRHICFGNGDALFVLMLMQEAGNLSSQHAADFSTSPIEPAVPCIDHNSQVLLAQKLLSGLARDPGSSKFKDLHQQTDDQQLEPMQKPFVGGAGGAGAGAHP
jgi:hypothetical protein